MAIKLKVGDLYEKLGKKMNEYPYLADLYITRVDSASTVGSQTGVKPENKLLSLRISAQSADGNVAFHADFAMEDEDD